MTAREERDLYIFWLSHIHLSIFSQNIVNKQQYLLSDVTLLQNVLFLVKLLFIDSRGLRIKPSRRPRSLGRVPAARSLFLRRRLVPREPSLTSRSTADLWEAAARGQGGVPGKVERLGPQGQHLGANRSPQLSGNSYHSKQQSNCYDKLLVNLKNTSRLVLHISQVRHHSNVKWLLGADGWVR